MFRQAIVFVASLVLAGVATAQPQPKKAIQAKTIKKGTKTTAKPVAKKAAKAKAGSKTKVAVRDSKTTKGKGKKGKKTKDAPWIPNQKTLSNGGNMPIGFSWPPTTAMLEAEKDCEAKLDRAGVEWSRTDREGRIVNAVTVPGMEFGGIKYSNMWGSKGPFPMDCQLALALETIGPELAALGVAEVKFGSLFRWSNVRSGGVTKPFLSRHGLGLAMDIGSFVDADGREAVIVRDYKKDDQLLHSVEQLINANGNFRIVLTPKNDPVSHNNHFHIEARANYISPELQ